MSSRPLRNAGWSSATSTPVIGSAPLRLLASGSTARTTSPPSTRLEIVHEPPSSAARSVIEAHPTPCPIGRVVPRPLSVTVTSSVPSITRATLQRRAPECFATLVIASEAIRKAATSTAAGTGGSSSGPVTAYSSDSVDMAAARCRRALTRPTSSMAGGRRSSTTRRISAIASLTSSRISAKRALRAVPSVRVAAAFSLSTIAAREGPTPSCRSRRRRFRSSSLAATIRDREACRSAVSCPARTRTAACRARSCRSCVSAAENDRPGGSSTAREPSGIPWCTRGARRTLGVAVWGPRCSIQVRCTMSVSVTVSVMAWSRASGSAASARSDIIRTARWGSER